MTSRKNNLQIRQKHGFPDNHSLGSTDYTCHDLHHPLSIGTSSQNTPIMEDDTQKNLHPTQLSSSNIAYPASPLLVYDSSCMASHQHYDHLNAFVNSNMRSHQHFGYPEHFSYNGPKDFLEDQYIFPEELFSVPFQDIEDHKRCVQSSSQSSVSSGKEQQQSLDSLGAYEHMEGAQSSRTRIKWTEELHNKFVNSVTCLGGAEKATPKAILNLMGYEGLTISHIKSHLQKYRVGKYMLDYVQEDADKRISTHDMHQLYIKTSLQIKETLQMQLQSEKHLREQLEILQNTQLMIEAQMEQLSKTKKLKADEGMHGIKNSNSSTSQDEPV